METGGLTAVLFPQNRDNSGPKLEGKENLGVWMAHTSNHAWNNNLYGQLLVWCKTNILYVGKIEMKNAHQECNTSCSTCRLNSTQLQWRRILPWMDQNQLRKTSHFFKPSTTLTRKIQKSKEWVQAGKVQFPTIQILKHNTPFTYFFFYPTRTKGSADVIWVLGGGRDETCMGHSRDGTTHKMLLFSMKKRA